MLRLATATPYPVRAVCRGPLFLGADDHEGCSLVRGRRAVGVDGCRGCAGQDLRVDRARRRSGVLRAADAGLDRDHAAASERNRHHPASGATAGGPARHIDRVLAAGNLVPGRAGHHAHEHRRVRLSRSLCSLRSTPEMPSWSRWTAPRFRAATRLRISQSPLQDFQSAAADNVQHQLQVAVVDTGGNVLMTAGPVSFYVHRAAVGGAR